MKSTRQPKFGIGLRICAVLSIFAWVWASSLCATESFLGHSHSDLGHGHANVEHGEHADASHSGHSHDSGDHEKGHSCCSTIQTVSASTSTFTFLKSDFGKQLSLHVVLLSQASTFAEPETNPPRQAKQREWVFTPEVYLGPAFRAHAPPLFI